MKRMEIYLRDGTVIHPAEVFEWEWVDGQPAIIGFTERVGIVFPPSNIARISFYE